MLAERVQYIKSAYQRLQIISQDPEKRAEYEALEKGLRDYAQMMKEAWEAGVIEGEAMAEARGEETEYYFTCTGNIVSRIGRRSP